MSIITKDRDFYSRLVRIAIPVTLQSLVMFGVNVTDTVMVGSLGEYSIAGVALGNQFSFLYQITCFGIAGGMGVLSAQFWGKKDSEAIGAGLSIILKIAFSFGLLYFITAAIFPYEVMGIYTVDEMVRTEGASYLQLLSLGYLFTGLTVMIASTLRSVGIVKLTLLTNCVALFLNMFFNWVFIFGNLGAPRMGVAGAALATTICRTVELSIVLIFLLKIDTRIRFRLQMLRRWDRDIFRNYRKNGVPVIVSDIFLGVGGNMISVVLGRMGPVVMSSAAIANTVFQLTTVFLMGVSGASGVITGNTVGAGEIEKAKEYGKTFLALAFVVSLFAITVIQLVKGVIFEELNIGGSAIKVFNVEDSTKEIAGTLINTLSCIAVFMTLSQILTKGILRAGGDTRFLMIADVLFLWVVSVPLGFLAGLVFKWPPYIVLFCLRIDEVIKSIWCLFRFFSWKWIRDVAVRGANIDKIKPQAG
ncbi:MAG: MATE family efflux transporter [Oscillospiraceae bacterium]|nr:MATE family efflux transporter [Oscillospiraceae bacterium]